MSGYSAGSDPPVGETGSRLKNRCFKSQMGEKKMCVEEENPTHLTAAAAAAVSGHGGYCPGVRLAG